MPFSTPHRVSKEIARSLAIEFAPECADLFRLLQKKGRSIVMPEEWFALREQLKIGRYVDLYADERHVAVALLLALFGKEGAEELDHELRALPESEVQAALDEFVALGKDEELESFFPPSTEAARQEALEQASEMTEIERVSAIQHAQWFWCYFFAQYHNCLSVMVHGEKLTSLVPKAMLGDDDAFCKAIQIDRYLLAAHPYFIARRMRAHEAGDLEFIQRLAYRERNPTLKGKIRYPGLYAVFACLESLNWLDAMSHAEILDICDEAGLDRFQNRIEDVTYVTKRLQDYRRFQKSGGMSMP